MEYNIGDMIYTPRIKKNGYIVDIDSYYVRFKYVDDPGEIYQLYLLDFENLFVDMNDGNHWKHYPIKK